MRTQLKQQIDKELGEQKLEKDMAYSVILGLVKRGIVKRLHDETFLHPDESPIDIQVAVTWAGSSDDAFHDQFDARVGELVDEFNSHYDQTVAADPVKNDRNIIFQIWIMQKLASLQIVTEKLINK